MQEVAIVLLDVGPLMSPIRDFAGKAVCGFLQSKVLYACSSRDSVCMMSVSPVDESVMSRRC